MKQITKWLLSLALILLALLLMGQAGQGQSDTVQALPALTAGPPDAILELNVSRSWLNGESIPETNLGFYLVLPYLRTEVGAGIDDAGYYTTAFYRAVAFRTVTASSFSIDTFIGPSGTIAGLLDDTANWNIGAQVAPTLFSKNTIVITKANMGYGERATDTGRDGGIRWNFYVAFQKRIVGKWWLTLWGNHNTNTQFTTGGVGPVYNF